MIVSPFCTIGPFFPFEFADELSDMAEHAIGTPIIVTGRVLEEGLGPTRNSIVEFWQPDSNGIFRHPLDPRFAEADPGFPGFGRARTDHDGWYRIRTVLPGAPVGRAPHINVMVLAIGLTRRLVTTVFFSDAPDPVLECVPPALRSRLIAGKHPDTETYRFDLILRGENETPFFAD
ncbi:MAG: protocatechuate 3,4-dioxygenase subunit alpha [Acidobacteriota bacterium]